MLLIELYPPQDNNYPTELASNLRLEYLGCLVIFQFHTTIVRSNTRIAQQICGDLTQDGQLKLLRLGDHWEQVFTDALKRDQRGEISDFQMSSEQLEKFGASAKEKIQHFVDKHHIFAVTTSAENRGYVRMIIERLFPTLPVISNLEIARGMDVKIIGSISE